MKDLPPLPQAPDFSEYKDIPGYTKSNFKGKWIIFITAILIIGILFYQFYPVIAKETKNFLNTEKITPQEFIEQLEENNTVIFKSEQTELFDKDIDATVLVVDTGADLELFIYADKIERVAFIDLMRDYLK